MPYDAILVQLDEGPLFVSNPLGFTCQAITFGDCVAVEFIDAEDEFGLFRLPVFQLTGG